MVVCRDLLSGTVPGCEHAERFGALTYSNCPFNIVALTNHSQISRCSRTMGGAERHNISSENTLTARFFNVQMHLNFFPTVFHLPLEITTRASIKLRDLGFIQQPVNVP